MQPEHWNLEPVSDDDLAAVLRLNQIYQHFLSPLTMEELRAILASSSHHRSIEGGKAFMIALDDQSNHQGENFRWFKTRYDSFIYIDRIAIDETLQRRGLAAEFYEDLETETRKAGRNYLCAEVGLNPANGNSLRFHDAMRFEQVGTGEVGGKTVQYFAKLIE